MSNLAARFATAVVVVPIVLAGLYYLPPVATLGAALVFTVCGAYEALGMFGHKPWSFSRLAGSALAGGFVAGGYYGSETSAGLLIVLVTTIMMALMMGLLGNDKVELAGRKMAGLVIALFYPALFLLLLALIRRDVAEYPQGWIVFSLMAAFFSDTGAYFAGKYLGKHKLAPRLSPNKTVEGAIGGLGGGVAAGLMAHFWYLPTLPLTHAIALGIAGSAVGQVGDLVESLWKRASNTKDSGTFFPGHGGVLDRLDAAVFVIGLVWIYLNWRGLV